ncbi:copper-translocating P-type ATPase [Geothermobacter hydrogeniphilus]|uniref:Copper-translocating P-type ATPase n=1 Tax=Geothermobacter hydrogeniphilus TaxID=1969733 RepID=A0A2K2HC57_9BACT|nr:heavy metal translocating P-type ATPase [Geothermobacter hydrogeniphilus]PNU20850.1 copper-translocating P-type ATPase [Geothermobacter hydrogeniphilus]
MDRPLPQCDHCRLPIPPADLVTSEHDGKTLNFCCHGCHGVYQLIHGAGLEDFYRRRDWREAGINPGVFERDFDPAEVEPHIRHLNEQQAEIHLLLDGIRCASCVWLIEKVLLRTPGVVDARINYGTHRLRLRFNPQQTDAAGLCRRIARIGYLPRPHTADAVRDRARRQQRSTLIRFGTAAFLSMQLMGYSIALYAGFFQGMGSGSKQIIQLLAALVTTPVVFYCGWPFLNGAWRSLRNRMPNMDLLIALGVLTAYGYSLFAMTRGAEVYFDTAAMIVTLILLGRMLEESARHRAASGIDRLLNLAPQTATRIDGNSEQMVPSSSLHPGDLVLVAPGERFPVDGALAGGSTEIDESALTGEPLPVCKRPGDRISAGTLNLTTAVTLRVTCISEDSFIARIARLVEEAQARRAPIQVLADRVAALFVPLVVSLSLATFIGWWLIGGNPVAGMLNAVAVLVIACPCALGLATPTAVLVATGQAARRGILFRGGDILERTGRLDTVAFDKTGTLTLGVPQVVELLPWRCSSEELLLTAATVEAGSSHPIARGILAAARNRNLPIPLRGGARTIPGQGVAADGPDGEIRVGNRAFQPHQIPAEIVNHGQAASEVHVSKGARYLGCILLTDCLRPEAAEVVDQLHAMGLRTVMLTGDRETSARAIAKQVGIDEIHAGLTPQLKAAWLHQLKATGQQLMMVGDGINDAPALAEAEIGCAMDGSTDIALENSDLVLTRPDLRRLVEAIMLSRRGLAIIRQNLGWAFAYNLVALPLAAAGQLLPIVAAAAMAFSSVCVVGNSLRLARRGPLPPRTQHSPGKVPCSVQP